MDFKKLVNYVENNKEAHFAKLVAENKRKLKQKREESNQKKEFAHQR